MKNLTQTHHDFAQFVAFEPDVIHEHFIGSELILNGQRVVLTLLHLLQLNSFTQVPHYLNPESSLVEEAKDDMGERPRHGSRKFSGSLRDKRIHRCTKNEDGTSKGSWSGQWF